MQLACMQRPFVNDFKRLGIAFKCYHAIRLGHPELVKKAVTSNMFDSLHELLLEYARQFADVVSLSHCVSH